MTKNPLLSGPMKTLYTAMTSRRANLRGFPTMRPYGYTLVLTPPAVSVSKGDDVEGIGWVPHWGGPRTVIRHTQGWYKHKADAVRRAAELNR